MARIIVNPKVFEDSRDALCVAYNEAFRVVMEETGFDPVSEPTKEQRDFFADTAYADDETQLRRTIIARICTFDTSVKDPTDEQLQEAVEFLSTVLEGQYPKTREEQAMVQKIKDILSAVPMRGDRGGTSEPPPPKDGEEAHADLLGGRQAEIEERLQETVSGGQVESQSAEAEGPGVTRLADEPPADAREEDEAARTASGAVLSDLRADAGGLELRDDWRERDPSVLD